MEVLLDCAAEETLGGGRWSSLMQPAPWRRSGPGWGETFRAGVGGGEQGKWASCSDRESPELLLGLRTLETGVPQPPCRLLRDGEVGVKRMMDGRCLGVDVIYRCLEEEHDGSLKTIVSQTSPLGYLQAW